MLIGFFKLIRLIDHLKRDDVIDIGSVQKPPTQTPVDDELIRMERAAIKAAMIEIREGKHIDSGISNSDTESHAEKELNRRKNKPITETSLG